MDGDYRIPKCCLDTVKIWDVYRVTIVSDTIKFNTGLMFARQLPFNLSNKLPDEATECLPDQRYKGIVNYYMYQADRPDNHDSYITIKSASAYKMI